MIINLSKKEIKALIVACVELNEKMPYVDKMYYEAFDLKFKSNEEIDGYSTAEDKLRKLLNE